MVTGQSSLCFGDLQTRPHPARWIQGSRLYAYGCTSASASFPIGSSRTLWTTRVAFVRCAQHREGPLQATGTRSLAPRSRSRAYAGRELGRRETGWGIRRARMPYHRMRLPSGLLQHSVPLLRQILRPPICPVITCLTVLSRS